MSYSGQMTDQNIRAVFENANDLIRRELNCCGEALYAYAIDGLIASGDASEYVIKPIAENLRGESVGELYQNAMAGIIYNVVAQPCKDLDDLALKLVNGFCVVLFPGEGALAFEVKTPDKRGTSAPEVENTVKGPKDAFVRRSVPTPAMSAAICEVRTFGSMKRRLVAEV